MAVCRPVEWAVVGLAVAAGSALAHDHASPITTRIVVVLKQIILVALVVAAAVLVVISQAAMVDQAAELAATTTPTIVAHVAPLPVQVGIWI